MTRSGRNDGDERETHTHTGRSHTAIQWTRMTTLRTFRASVWAEGCRNGAAHYRAVRLIPASVAQGLLAALPRANSHSTTPHSLLLLLLSSHMWGV